MDAKILIPVSIICLINIATEAVSHLEILGGTIQMLLTGINDDLKEASETDELSKLLKDQASKEDYIHNAMINPLFCSNRWWPSCIGQ